MSSYTLSLSASSVSVGSAVTITATILPSGSEFTGTLDVLVAGPVAPSLEVITLSAATSGTATFTPTNPGLYVAVPMGSSGGLALTSAVYFQATAVPAAGYTLTALPSTLSVGQGSILQISSTPAGRPLPPGAITLALSGSGTAILDQSTVTANGQAQQQVRLLATGAGTITVTPTNTMGLSNPSAVNITAS